jgi:uncharacterized protein (DUF2062 family)
MRRVMRRWLPSPERVRAGRSLRWLAPLLARPWLWHIDRHGVALGVAIGVFFGFLVPIAQIPLSAVFVFLLRANLPAAVLSTLVSNPFTYAPIFIAAHRVGRMLLGNGELDNATRHVEAAGEMETLSLLTTISDLGAPLFAGLAVFAVVGALLAWALVQAAWLAGNAWRARRLARRRAQRYYGQRDAVPPADRRADPAGGERRGQ